MFRLQFVISQHSLILSGVPIQTKVVLNNRDLILEDNESVLNASIRAKLHIPNSCRNGICQTCLIKVDDGEIPATSQKGLSENQKRQKLALACQLVPKSDLVLSTRDKSQRTIARVIELSPLNSTVMRLRLHAEIDWHPGQFLTLWKGDEVGRPYSVASLNSEGFLEFHIKHHQQGELSQWIHNELKVGDSIKLGEANGNCFYNETMKDKPLLLAGIGTGLAPLYGITRDALASGHTAPIHLLSAATIYEDHYLLDELYLLDKKFENFSFYPILRDETKAGFIEGDITKLTPELILISKNWCVFLCGAPNFVQKMQKMCFLSGVSMANIFSDPFIHSAK